MKRFFLLIFAAAVATTAVKAQDYNWGAGIRGGGMSSGITMKGFIKGANALEGMLSFQNGVNFYGLYERNVPLNGKGFNFYYGGGANIGNWKKSGKEKFTLGIDGVIGVDYKILQAPIVVGIDYKPCLNLTGHSGLKLYDFGFNVRVVF